jgi:hypothetical protein
VPSDYVVSVFHHPYNWLAADWARSFRDHIEKTSDLILTGHEHEANHYLKYTFKGEVTEYLEGAVFQEADRPDRSGFNAIWIDLETQKQKLQAFVWEEGLYTPSDLSGGWIPYRRGSRRAKQDFDLSPEIGIWLDDPGADFVHPAKPDLKLTDIFVFPNLREYKSRDKSDPVYDGILDGKDFLKVLGSKRRLLILARQQTGKTTLAKVIFRDAYNKGITPIYLRGDDLPSSVDIEKFENAVRKAFQRQYLNPILPMFDQLDRDKTLIILDDFDHSRLNPRGRLKLLKNIHERFDRLCILGDEALRFEEVAYSDLSASILSEYGQYELLEFGYFLRSKLIEQWFDLGSEYTANPEELAKRTVYAENLITDLLGRSYLPSIPIFILSFLQALDSTSPVSTAAGTYGSLYEVLIIRALATKAKTFNIDLKTAYLSELAFWMFSTQKRQITEHEWDYFQERYCQKFKIQPAKADLQQDFHKSGLIDRLHDFYQFRHAYAYYYFVARYFRDNIQQPEVRTTIESLCSKLFREEHASIWLFLTHLSKDPFIVEVILRHSRSIFQDVKPIEFGGDVEFIQNLYDKIPTIVLRDGDFRELKEARLRRLDEETKSEDDIGEEDAEKDEMLSVMARLSMALRTLEVLGQLVKNFPGSLIGTVKHDLVKECYSLGLRTTESVLGALRENSEGIVAALVELVREKYPKMEDSDRLTDKVRLILYWLVEGACFSMVKRTSHSVGHSSLGETYREVLQSMNSNAVKLIDLSVKLDALDFPLSRLKELKKDFKSNIFCDRLLKHLVVHYLYIFPTSDRLKQQICQEMDIPIKRLRGLDLATQQQKRLPAGC